MTAPATEKAAPIPAEVLATARNSVADQVAKEGGPGSLVQRIRDGKKDDWLVPTAVAAILADRASQEERIRENERDRLLEIAYTNGKFLLPVHDQAIRQFLTLQRAMLPADRARLRGDAS